MDRAKRVLIVEDSLVNQKAISNLVHSLGFAFDLVSDGEQAVSSASRNKYSLILMDLRLPFKDGFAATRAIRTQGIDVPVIAMSAYPLGSDWPECVEAGFDDFLHKGCKRSELETVLSTWTDTRSDRANSTH